ncbi:palmitoyl-protein thioesterase 1-like [Dermacentor variabilis]|uniref:palmitoyl-protein thioesterase 1-like n=1 Tax=Dermacentor variabilis TaxID=34621 RepID=UPI003F5B530F
MKFDLLLWTQLSLCIGVAFCGAHITNGDRIRPLSRDGESVSQAFPIVMWHGLGDSCCNPLSLGGFKNFLEQSIPGVYVNSLRIGTNMIDEIGNSYFMNTNAQVEEACNIIANDSKLSGGYNALGFSQGGQFLRAVAQRCPEPPIRNLISLGGQHQGVYGLPRCPGESSALCEYARKLLNIGAYWDVVQEHLVPAQYWQDPFDRHTYIAKSLFLSDINNERVKNETYKANLLKLNNLVLVLFENDTVVDPKATSWFGYYAEHDDKTIVPLHDQKIYTEDWIGLKELDQSGRLHFLSTLGDHLQFKDEWFTENIIKQYLL